MTGEPESSNVAGFVLAGGGSTRFGRDKALVTIGGDALIARLCLVMRLVTPRVTIVGSPEKYGGLGVERIPDRWPGQGPLGGIVTALITSLGARDGAREKPARMPFASPRNAQDSAEPGRETNQRIAQSEWNLIIGCDMPFLSHEWLEYLVQRALASEAEVVAPKSEHGLEPLCACWRTSAADTLGRAFEQGMRKVTEGMKHLKMEVLDEIHWKRFDNAERLFWNMNTPEDYEEAKRILEAEGRRE